MNNHTIEESDIVVLWSGGLDSTYLLHHILSTEEYQGTKVCGVSLTPNFIPTDKAANESRARNLYINEVITKRGFDNFCYTNLNLYNMPPINSPHNTGGVQFAFWIASVYPYVKSDAVMMLSNIKGDDQLPYIDEARRLVESLNKFYNKNVKLAFPLALCTKPDMFVLAADYDILEYTWSCESGDYKDDMSEVYVSQCKNCASCFTHISGMVTAASFPDSNPLIHEYAREYFGIDTGNVIEGMPPYTKSRADEIKFHIDLAIKESGANLSPKIVMKSKIEFEIVDDNVKLSTPDSDGETLIAE